MTEHTYKNIIRWGIMVVTLFIVSLILWNTYVFFQKYKDEERIKVEILAAALERLNDPDLDAEMSLEIEIINSNHNIPMIMTDEDGEVTSFNNLDKSKEEDPDYLSEQLAIMKAQNQPIRIQYKNSPTKQYIYFKHSDILNRLKYYPLGLVLILFLFSVVIFLFSKSNSIASQNILWTGMAKETAHQIGTPLTSLLGWVAILREDKENEEVADEIEKDVQRLETIANRFSKIGSETPLQKHNIVSLTEKVFNYFKSRSSDKIVFELTLDEKEHFALANSELFGWVIENMIKNAIDAMQGKGKIEIAIRDDSSDIIINIKDTGKGMPKNMYKRIFEPGFTTKKRGWGLGLSLSKRIIEKFHHGKIYVQESHLDKGTNFCIKLPKA